MKKAIFEMGESSVKLPMPVYIVNGASIAGTKEGQGPLGSCIDHVLTDDQFGADSWEAAECKLQKETVAILLKKTEVSEKEIRYLRDKHIDLAFVVLDPRLGTGAYKGMDVFLNAVQADLVFPMHLWERFDLVRTYKKRPQVSAFLDKIVDVDRDNVIFEIE